MLQSLRSILKHPAQSAELASSLLIQVSIDEHDEKRKHLIKRQRESKHETKHLLQMFINISD